MQLQQFTRKTLSIVRPLVRIQAGPLIVAITCISAGIAAIVKTNGDPVSTLFVMGTQLLSTFAGLLAFSTMLLQAVRDARSMQAPGSHSQVLGAHIVAIFSLVIVPSLLMIILGDAWIAASILCCTGLLALTIPLILFSRPWIIGFNKTTMLFVIPMSIAAVRGIYFAANNPEQTSWSLLPTIVLLTGVLLWHWYAEFNFVPSRHNHMSVAAGKDLLPATSMQSAAGLPAISRTHSASPATTVRMYIGNPYVQNSMPNSFAFFGLLLSIVIALPLLVFLSRSTFTPDGALRAWYLTYPFSLVIATWATWVFHMRAVAKAFGNTGIYIHEFALLPGMGNSREQLRGLIRGVFSRPIMIITALLLFALLTVYHQYHQWLYVAMVLLGGCLIVALYVSSMLWCMIGSQQALTAELRNKQFNAAVWQAPLYQNWIWLWFPFLIPHPDTPLSTLILKISIATFLLGSIFFPASGVYLLFKLSRRPHPFVEVA